MSHENEDILDEILKALEIKGSKITVVIEHSHLPGETDGGGGGGSFGGSLSIGDLVGGGGVVSGVTESSVTVNFPGGVSKGPIDLPGVDTTIVVKESVSPEEPVDPAEHSTPLIPWTADDVFTIVDGETLEVGPLSQAVNIHTDISLPCPGNIKTKYLRIKDKAIFNVRNSTQNCPCATLFITSIGADGRVKKDPQGGITTWTLPPGHFLPEYQAEPDAVAIIVTCNGHTTCTGCSAQLSYDNKP